jgi:phosphatidylglycerophosphatase A
MWQWEGGALPGVSCFWADGGWLLTAVLFGLFRFFDVVKPWPVAPAQRLPGGWGVALDDVLAALYVSLLTPLLMILFRMG